MTFQGNIRDLQRANVIDSTGDKVGSVGQVYVTNEGQDPSWVTVKTGLFGTKETFIPLSDAQFTDGDIRVPYEKSFIKDAPNIDEDGEISQEQEAELYRYYGVQDPSRGTGTLDAGDRTDRTVGNDRTDLDNTHRGTAAGVGAAGAGAGVDRDHDRRDGVDGDGVTLHEERLNVGTQKREAGKARLRKYVVTETEQVEVPVQREELVVERTPATGEDRGGTLGEDETTVTLHEERPVVEKETVATENVKVGKRTVTDTETVTEQVGHEEVDVQTGFDKDGYDRDGFNRDGVNREGVRRDDRV
ncbi:PRC and DUF2382 domain-containing protein [Brachybacterium muris]|uniref:PRC and DUF2382 domain-containing protein n=1 Tax=Brachybacterium muris TaxID=219301 RepID=UPI00223B3E66|nr:PRC and DUF2382 domain-containing protein [Brachybacterium muris]MCT2261270.1 PRC and DUF2382 domain-containing protein [Brachybacterium muris]